MAIKMNMEVMELMFYYWQATSEREKVGEAYLATIANNAEMEKIYTEEFTGESVRRALSAITNREIFSAESKKESRFWNNNMWAMEDMGLMEAMMAPLKVMNLDDVKVAGDLDVVILPMHMDTFYKKDGQLFINFFRIQADIIEGGPLKIEDTEIKAWIEKIAA
ncbi:hypothetical protein M3P05_04405 [Sansalvadorimonas sp. 2012CJ34-2]|uniref:Uncharacterized protein n=1 Tax=Parendozoicomonas callyspongiae TaxID=2942213 RepID=A0ABT0PCY0_9GAMM|nr:hypothetical protein [Sansalvadorimonas sp. 2012CJ34-2]MCL6269185.1 hypothetical protein [Sansalvadorimonas sp. 2012CJ34-2]